MLYPLSYGRFGPPKHLVYRDLLLSRSRRCNQSGDASRDAVAAIRKIFLVRGSGVGRQEKARQFTGENWRA